MTLRATALAALLVLAHSGAAHAQTPSTPRLPQQCVVLPDTFRGPNPRQVVERRQLRARMDSIARAAGVAEPRGLLLVDVDSTRRGKVLFLETNLPDPVVQRATVAVQQYLSTLVQGRAYQALIRIDGDYVPMAPGKRHCIPAIANDSERSTMMKNVLDRHPDADRNREPITRRVQMRLVVNREGDVSYVDVEQPSGDAFLDPLAPEIARRLRFHPARLDGIPFDARFRYTMTFVIE
jgi:TonB family protein